MEHEINIDGHKITFLEPDRSRVEKFAEKSQSRFLAMMNIQVFLQNIQQGNIESFVGITEKQEQAFEELEKTLNKTRDEFYDMLVTCKAKIDDKEISKENYLDVFSWSSVATASRLNEAVTAFVAEVSITDVEVKN